ncbi:2-oxo-4-hydroxy-4-carboxy-5-ureidoimidazoline decarboxylase [Arthrobacter sp. AZCC_0090]|uniref:2-oxo-4-hydroxy-4-carboxy-5-ureidoimidazoline decarboxylase n=1 Tax=Arthrobacter sp. AZCC_0090 TaxID=2735881 RepID=UPI001621135F|nr:2-oxo-4-hydroxy-4-carboxy-5-ureidoimidazoline decarboxylase [Arthrobacter sp. AZCC_0090]MBB6405730.1 2-oxo-4-hydroxy-4-carboxy-5-ureidoimidazoline decarboxylase [Arthrobacter sp. AZCC_0090]
MSTETTVHDGLEAFNSLPEAEALTAVASCCPLPEWGSTVVSARPFRSVEEAEDQAGVATRAIPDGTLPDVLNLFPPIAVDRGGDSRAANWSRQEEAAIHASASDVKAQLVETGLKFKERFGYTFVIAAAGRTSPEVLEAMKERLRAEPGQELATSRQQLELICRMRIAKLMQQLDPGLQGSL